MSFIGGIRSSFRPQSLRTASSLLRLSAATLDKQSFRGLASSSVDLTADVHLGTSGLEITWNDSGAPSHFSFQFLRDHGVSPTRYNLDTNQRKLQVTDASSGCRPAAVDIKADRVVVHWEDDDPHTFSLRWLRMLAEGGDVVQRFSPVSWIGSTIDKAPPAVHVDSLASGDGFVNACSLLDKTGFVFVDGVEATPEATKAMIEHFGVIRNTLFGELWDFTSNGAMKDTAYSNEGIGLHTDGCYFEEAPGLQVFHCLEFNGTGADTLLADGLHAAQKLKARSPEAFAVLTNVRIPFHYIGDGYHLVNRAHIIQTNSRGDITQVRYNNYDRAPLDLSILETCHQPGAPQPQAWGMGEVYDALQQWTDILNHPLAHFKCKLAPGRAVVINNRRVLHARTEFSGKRRLCGAYVGQEEWVARRRWHISQQGKAINPSET